VYGKKSLLILKSVNVKLKKMQRLELTL